MSSLYKKKNTWYLSVQVNGKRISKSLKTSSKNVAVLLKDKAEYELITEFLGLTLISPDLIKDEISSRVWPMLFFLQK